LFGIVRLPVYRTFTVLLLGVALSQQVLALSIDHRKLEGDPFWQCGQGSMLFATEKLIKSLRWRANAGYPRFQSMARCETTLTWCLRGVVGRQGDPRRGGTAPLT